MELHIDAGSRGPWYDAIIFLEDSQDNINAILKRAQQRIPIRDINFFNDPTRNITSEIEECLKCLENVNQKHEFLAKDIQREILNYVEETMRPNLLTLEMIILLNAFHLKNKPIIDIFYTYDSENKRVLKDSKDFYYLIAGRFMVFYYKVYF